MNDWICDIAYYPVRAEPDHSSQMVSMLLFGDVFDLTDSYNNWYCTINRFDKYEGWIYVKEINKIANKTNLEVLYTTKMWTLVLYKSIEIYLGVGSALPLNPNSDEFTLGNKIFNIDKKERDQVKIKTVSDIIELALRFYGTPYLWGGKTSHGFDCSGFIQTLFKTAGIVLPRDTRQQIMTGSETNSPSIGDLAFFVNEGKIDHIGLLYDEDKIIHASGYVKTDRFDEKGIYNEKLKEYTHQLHSIRSVK